jgi:hypothetical protein
VKKEEWSEEPELQEGGEARRRRSKKARKREGTKELPKSFLFPFSLKTKN